MVSRLPDRGRSAVILIGTWDYQSADLANIASIESNLSDLMSVLTDPLTGAFDATNCTPLANPSDWREVYKSVQRIGRTAEDTLLIYFSGHGKVVPPRNDLYLCVAETDLDAIPATALPYNLVRDLVLASPALNKIVLLDCCFSGRAAEREALAAPGAIADQAEISGSYLMTAVDSNVLAMAPRGARNTAFTGALLETMRSGEGVRSKYLTLSSVYTQTRNRLARAGLPHPIQHGSESIGELAVALNPLAYGVRSWTRVMAPLAEQKRQDLAARASAFIESIEQDGVKTVEASRTMQAVEAAADKEIRSLASLQSSIWGRDDSWNGRLLSYARSLFEAAVTALAPVVPARRRSWPRRPAPLDQPPAGPVANLVMKSVEEAQDRIRRDNAHLETILSEMHRVTPTLHEYWTLLNLLAENADARTEDYVVEFLPMVTERRADVDEALSHAVAWSDAITVACAGNRACIKQCDKIMTQLRTAAGALDADPEVREAIAGLLRAELDRLATIEAELADAVGARPPG